MYALDYQEKKYFNLILKGNYSIDEINFINDFNNNFIAKYIYGVAFGTGNTFNDLIECNIGYKTDTNKVKEKNIIELFFCELPESLHNVDKNFSLNILEVINRHISSRGDDFYYYIRNCIYYALDDVASMYYFPINIIDDQKYINIINYCLFYSASNKDENKIIEYGELLLKELSYSYLFNDKSEMSLIDNEKYKLKESLEIAINRYKEFTDKRFIKAFNINFPNSRDNSIFTKRILETKQIIANDLDLINEDSNSEKVEHPIIENTKEEKEDNNNEELYKKIQKELKKYIKRGTPENYSDIVNEKAFSNKKKYLIIDRTLKKDCVLFAKVFNLTKDRLVTILKQKDGTKCKEIELTNQYFNKIEINLANPTEYEKALIKVRNEYLNKINPSDYSILERKHKEKL